MVVCKLHNYFGTLPIFTNTYLIYLPLTPINMSVQTCFVALLAVTVKLFDVITTTIKKSLSMCAAAADSTAQA